MRAMVGLCVLLAACAAPTADVTSSTAADNITDGSPEAIGVLAVANTVTQQVLDVNVGLDSRAAAGIVAARPLTTVEQLDAVAYVGASALAKLEAYADAHGYVPGQTIDGVALTDAQAAQLLAVANLATELQLDGDAALDSRAATNIVAARPFTALAQLGAVKYVGASAVTKLLAFAARFEPTGCTLALVATTDAHAADLTKLLALSGVVDHTAYEVLAARATGCPGVLSDDGGAALIAAVEAFTPWNQRAPFIENAIVAGDAQWTTEIGVVQEAVQDDIANGWVPSSVPDGATLYAELPQLIADLTPTPTAASAMYEVGIVLNADECSQRVVALIDPTTWIVWLAHRFSEC